MKSQRKFWLVLFFAAFMFVVKPFVGFVVFNRLHPPAKPNIFLLQKSFSKRIIQYRDGSLTKMAAIQKKLADPGIKYNVTFLFWLLSLSALVLADRNWIVIRNQGVSSLLFLPVYLLNRQIIV